MSEKTVGYYLSSLIGYRDDTGYTEAHAIARVWMAINPNLFLSLALIPNLAHQTGHVVQLKRPVFGLHSAAIDAMKGRLESSEEGWMELLNGHSFLVQPHLLKELSARIRQHKAELVECNPYCTRS